MAKENKTQRQAKLKKLVKDVEFVPDPVKEYMNAPLDAEVTEEQDAALEELLDEEIGETELNTESAQMEEGDVEIDEEKKEPVSIVKDKFKKKYAENAAAIGDTRKQVKRSNWDWLAQNLATFCLNEKGKIDIGSFQDVLEANGIDHTKWANRTKGWEGRFRMTGRVALQKVVANSGQLIWPNGDVSAAPAEFCEKYKSKA